MQRKLELSTTLSGWYQFEARRDGKSFLAFAKKVYERDRYTCQFCHFQASNSMEVINVDQDYKNNVLDNMVTACPLCAQCYFLEHVGQGEFGGGTLIYLPEMSMSSLNGLCHVLFCAMTSASTYYSDAQTIYRELKMRSQLVEKYFGEGLSDPALLGRAILDSHVEKTLEKGLMLLENVRLLPSRSKFKGLVDKWAKTAAGNIT
jgi:intracellular multiplication protein IcmJ